MAYASRHRRMDKLLAVEQFESRLCLSGVVFASHVIAANDDRVTSVFAADNRRVCSSVNRDPVP